MTRNAFRSGKVTGETISWFAREPRYSNACCLYCGRSVAGPEAVASDLEHLIARNFVPKGTLSGNPFNFLFRACRECNARKAAAERHVSSVTLFNSPGRAIDARANAAAIRKGDADFHPKKKGVRIQDSHENLKIEGRFGAASMSFELMAPPQLQRSDVEEVALSHIQGLFSLITTEDYQNSYLMRLLPQDQFQWFGSYTHGDWGNPQAKEIANRVRNWKCYANISSAEGYFKAILRCGDDGWFWALEWNKHLRLLGGIGLGHMPLFDELPSPNWLPTPTGRMRCEVPLDPGDDILFVGKVQVEK